MILKLQEVEFMIKNLYGVIGANYGDEDKETINQLVTCD